MYMSWTLLIMLLYPASETSPPSSHTTLSMHSSDSMMAMYMSWTLLIMLLELLSSTSRLFLTGTVVTLGNRRKRAAAIRRGMMIMDIPSLPETAPLSPPYESVG